MNVFAALLGALTVRPVVDQTGLSGRYDLDLELTEDDYNAMTILAGMSTGEALSLKDLQQLAAVGDPLPRVLRSLGLDLKRGKGHVEVVIVDDVRKDPTET